MAEVTALVAVPVALLLVAVAAPLVAVVVAALITPLFAVTAALSAAFAVQFDAEAELGFVDGLALNRCLRCSHHRFLVALFVVRVAAAVATLAILVEDVLVFSAALLPVVVH
eukprot:CAMPEP_0172421496 /NCGR_PEP_ID=MMETSP1064-20121228/7742_1 /TAXON_ID=202472 /ORGANISM="Aulacoseira subarctica , Strain CCAP 1002/5" /LENGTH=111 /DNA_ID=CAMNT_0013161929 /DNA_START=67 /DNA_END=403 /DNA_ORIENTATION=-